ncbi:cobalamin/Fe(3+)-siderophore ABC transporter ATP-binding protein [Fischerella thermalis CCMEE 5330]|uniref:Cobalamin/Fe(3+)-siderophore ABC transporter ATP-binding protein n=1 Tax=Fischerella thermalis CCMEE 5330 TaxID=2019670 RepID=A0A2N6MFJ7_9CYAN|nr:ABC transporter ATP-binding protein [Fischerella thermalis]PMB45554.1 cobalamin/Fe(3+)-siderophore ABC transporter ATP-binding protein [Fischerella thermalis CCMEE 5330]
MKGLSTKSLSLAYDGVPIIRDLNLAIPSGQISVLVGANGCGKSTLLRGLARLLKPLGGTVYLNGESIFKLSTKEVGQQLGILPQGPVAPEGLTVRDLVAQGRYPYQNWLQQWSAKDEKIVQQALEITNLLDLAERELDTLSGGQRQRAWIAMALAQDTDILLLDEPTTFLDLAHQIEVLDLLYELHQTQGRTIVMVLHDLNHACRYADYLVAVKDGRIFTAGEPKLVMTEEMVLEVFGLECRVVNDPVVGTPMCVPIGRKGTSKLQSNGPNSRRELG